MLLSLSGLLGGKVQPAHQQDKGVALGQLLSRFPFLLGKKKQPDQQ